MKRIKANEPEAPKLTDEDHQRALRAKSKALASKSSGGVLHKDKPPEDQLALLRYRMALKEKMLARFGHREWMDSVPPPESIGLTWDGHQLVPLTGKRVRA